jgi:hypothetical protein
MSAKPSAKPSATRVVLWTLLGLALVGVLVAWWLATHKRVEQVIDLPRTGEARRNPLYALKVALEKDDIRVNARRRLQLLPGNGREAAIPLATRDTVVLYNDPRTLTSAEISTLLAWVQGGGHLIVRTPPHGLLAKDSPAPLLSELQLLPLSSELAGCEELKRGAASADANPDADGDTDVEPDADNDSDAASDNEDYADAASDVMFCGGRRFTLDGANPKHSWGDLKNGYVFARIDRGQGSVDVLADLDFLSSDGLEAPASHDFARQLLEPNYRAGTVHLVYAAEMPSLWLTLIQHSWMAWGPLLLAFLFWLWRRMQRFGPQLAAPATERRSLLEHIVASGEHAYRYGYAHLLYAAVRNAFLARLRRRDPQAAALEGDPQLMLLTERFKDVAAHDIRDALMSPFANDHAAFRSRIATLIRLRNRL